MTKRMWLAGVGMASLFWSVAAPAASKAPPDLGNAVVKIFSTVRYPDAARPWTKQAPSEISGSGVIIEGHRILTNAHVVLYASQVQVQANQSGDKISATVESIAPGIDLAVLKLDEEGFFDTHAPMARANALPRIKDAVLAYGFPQGGNSLSITKGIVSRIEFMFYNYPVSGLRIQIDAAINPGNSGGPAVAGDRMIGLAFSRAGGDSQNIGYIIPNEEIDLFLADVRDGRYDGKPAMFDDFQTLENPSLRSFLQLDRSVEGIIVHRPYHDTADYPLKEWDVITHIGGTPVDDQGMIRFGADLRVNFTYLVQKVARNGKLPLSIVRKGSKLDIELPVSSQRPLLIPEMLGEYPPYFIYGPLVFSKATAQLLSLIGGNPSAMHMLSFIGSPLITMRGAEPGPDREELVVVSSPMFPHRISKGYSNLSGAVVSSVNGIRIHSLAHLVSVLRDLKDPFVAFEFENRSGEAVVFARGEVEAATEEILGDNGVRAQGSPDTLKVWQSKP
ncbi:MAG: trypsin-like peptidase domain-containing protein [Steroidobacteraceae bacterium]